MRIKKILSWFAVVVVLGIVVLGIYVYANSSTFVFTPWGSIYVRTVDCEKPYDSFGQSMDVRYTKLKNTNFYIDEVEKISTHFIRINGQVYDAYVAEFQRAGIQKTNNILNDINEAEFRVVDTAQEYFTDGEKYYIYNDTNRYIKYYPTYRACFSVSDTTFRDFLNVMEIKNEAISEPYPGIRLHEFALANPDEASLYSGQTNIIRLTSNLSQSSKLSYTPYANLHGMLYFKNDLGQFVPVEGVNIETLNYLFPTLSTYDFFTDGRVIVFKGKILDVDLATFKAITVEPKHLGYKISTDFFTSDATVFHLKDNDLQIIEADGFTFEVVDTDGNYSGRIYRDKDYIYTFDKKSDKFIKQKRDSN
jgi:hypothetical protein